MAMCRYILLVLLLLYLCASVFTHRRGSRNHRKRKGKVVELKGQPFKIMTSKYQACLSVQSQSHWSYNVIRPLLTLAHCNQNSTTGQAQVWQWTKNGQLQLIRMRRCLTSCGNNGLYLEPCSFARHNNCQQWKCDGNFLKLKRKKRYLAPFWCSNGVDTLFRVTVRPSPTEVQYVGFGVTFVYGSSGWTKHKTNVTICDTS